MTVQQNPYQNGLLAQTYGMWNMTFWYPKSWGKRRKYSARNMWTLSQIVPRVGHCLWWLLVEMRIEKWRSVFKNGISMLNSGGDVRISIWNEGRNTRRITCTPMRRLRLNEKSRRLIWANSESFGWVGWQQTKIFKMVTCRFNDGYFLDCKLHCFYVTLAIEPRFRDWDDWALISRAEKQGSVAKVTCIADNSQFDTGWYHNYWTANTIGCV